MSNHTTRAAEIAQYRIHQEVAISGCVKMGYALTEEGFKQAVLAAVRAHGGVCGPSCVEAADALAETVAAVYSDTKDLPDCPGRTAIIQARLGALFPR